MALTDDTATHIGSDLPRWGRYILRARLGEGAQGSVYLAWDPQLECDIALKVVRLDAPDEAESASGLREARALARVRHPNVVNVYGVETHEGKVGICMELVKGRTLEDVLAAQGRFGPQEAVTVGLAVGRALAAVHGAGLVHRDIKGRNVMREDTGRIVLMDFGTGRDRTQLMAGSDVSGTPVYMAPELFLGNPASQQSDVYSVGVLLYHLVTGAYPVEGRTLAEIASAHAFNRRTPIVERRPDLSEDFIRVVDVATALNPAERYSSAAHLVHGLAAIERPEPAQPAQARTVVQRLTSAAIVLVAAAAAVTLLGFISSAAYNAMLERAEFAAESPLDWMIWGLRSLVGPIANVAQTLIVVMVLVALWRLARRLVAPLDRWARRVSAAASAASRRAGLHTPSGFAQFAFALGAVYLIAVCVIYWPLISAMLGFVSTMRPDQLEVWSPANQPWHSRYRSALDWLVLGAGWSLLYVHRLRRARPDAADGLPVIALGVTLVLAVLLWVIPYRIAYWSERPRIDIDGERCYDLGRRDAEVLTYCPGIAQPRVRRRPANDPGIRDTGVTESVFAPR